MKGVILAGGLGSRLLPMTRVTNKHLLPVYDRPMVYYPLQQLVHCGIREILIVTGGTHAGDFLRLLKNGREFGLEHLDYTFQEGRGGVAEALSLAEHFAEGGPLMVILGDNIFQDSLAGAAAAFLEGHPGESVSDGKADLGALILLKEVKEPQRFGVPELDAGRIVSIREKPVEPPSPYAVTGCYFFDHRVFEIIHGLEPSERGELEITDVNNRYVEWGRMRHRVLGGWWTDAGTLDSYYRSHDLVAGDPDNPILRPGHVSIGAEP